MLDVISVDCGRSGVKAMNETERVYFPAALGAWRELRNGRSMGLDDLDVEYKSMRYFAGRVAEDEAEDGSRLMLAYKAHQDTKILTLAAVHRLVAPDARVMLVTGLPLAFHNEHDKQRMRDLFIGDHELTVNGVRKRFSIERVEVGAEGATVSWSLGRYRRDRFHVIDVGSRTVNYATAINGRWVDKESDSLDYGFETFRGTEAQFARVVVGDLSRMLRPLGPTVLIGGKETLIPYLREYHGNVEAHPDPLFANAVAFRELGVIANGRPTAQATER